MSHMIYNILPQQFKIETISYQYKSRGVRHVMMGTFNLNAYLFQISQKLKVYILNDFFITTKESQSIYGRLFK